MRNAIMQQHFDRLAPEYNTLRTTDLAPVDYIGQSLSGTSVFRCADVGCGAGRYDLLLLRALPQMYLACFDINQTMLDETDAYLRRHGESRYSLHLGSAESFNPMDEKLDCVVSFNAIHHIDPVAFLKQARKVLKPAGHIFVYTRLPSQNEASIWGRFFPDFLAKETRLYHPETIAAWSNSVEGVDLEHLQNFSYCRRASLQQLVNQASSRHYSTFEFYSDQELTSAIKLFRKRIQNSFTDEDRVAWCDANVMITFRTSP